MMKFISDDNKQKFKSDSVLLIKIFSIKTSAIKLLNGLKKMKV